jgi:hypothetical protein
MTEWINVNLPWLVDVEDNTPEYPKEAVDKVVRAEFGFTEDELYENFRNKHNVEAWAARYDSEQPERDEADALFAKIQSINEFVENADIPELNAWVVESDRVDEEAAAERKRTSFRYSDLNRPGVLIEVQYNDKVKQFFLGHINCNAGVCDDCTAFDNDAIVLRAKILVQESEIGNEDQ